MLKYLLFSGIILAIIGALVFGARGCDGFFPQESVFVETEDSQYLRGKELLANGRDVEALRFFHAIIRSHPDISPESNFEAGLIAFRRKQYPLAIYHFRQFLELSPDHSRRKNVVDLINSSEKEFLVEMLPGIATGKSSTDFEEKYLAAMRENDALKRKIEILSRSRAVSEAGTAATANPVPATATPAPVPEPPHVETPPTPPPPPKPDVPATHTVVPGDTLSSISKKYYGTTARVNDIFKANRVTMSSPNALKPGMVLKLPRP